MARRCRCVRQGALAIADLDQVPQGVGGLIALGFVSVVTVGDRYRAEPDPKLEAFER